MLTMAQHCGAISTKPGASDRKRTRKSSCARCGTNLPTLVAAMFVLFHLSCRAENSTTKLLRVRFQQLLGVLARSFRQLSPAQHARDFLGAFFGVERPHQRSRPTRNFSLLD